MSEQRLSPKPVATAYVKGGPSYWSCEFERVMRMPLSLRGPGTAVPPLSGARGR